MQIYPFYTEALAFLSLYACPVAQSASREAANRTKSIHTSTKARIFLRTSFRIINNVSLNELVIGRSDRCLSAVGREDLLGASLHRSGNGAAVVEGGGGSEVRYVRDAATHLDLAGLDTGM